MSELALALEVAVVLLGVPAGYAALGRRARRRGLGASVMAPLEEIWDPVAHRTNVEVSVHAERSAPAPGIAPPR